MKKIHKFHLVAQRQQGNNIKLEWSKIPDFLGKVDESNLQTIDGFTSMFENEQELKDYIKQYAMELGLSIKPKKYPESELSEILENILFSQYDEQIHSYEFKRSLFSFVSSISSDIKVMNKLQEVTKTKASKEIKYETYQAIIKKTLYQYIKSGFFPKQLKKDLFIYINNVMTNNEYADELNEKIEKMEEKYIFETHPLKIIFYIGGSQRVLYDGVAYKKDVFYINKENITQYLKSKAIENDFDLLNRIIKLYGKNPRNSEYIDVIRKYIELQKAKQHQDLLTPIPTISNALSKLVEHEISEIDAATLNVNRNLDGNPIVDYYNLRKLGMFLSKYDSEKQKIYSLSRKYNLEDFESFLERGNKPSNKTFQLSMFENNNPKN